MESKKCRNEKGLQSDLSIEEVPEYPSVSAPAAFRQHLHRAEVVLLERRRNAFLPIESLHHEVRLILKTAKNKILLRSSVRRRQERMANLSHLLPGRPVKRATKLPAEEVEVVLRV